MKIRKIQKKDINQVVNLHLKNIRQGFLFSMGKHIGKIIYRNTVSSGSSFCYIVENNGEIVASCGYINDIREFTKRIIFCWGWLLFFLLILRILESSKSLNAISFSFKLLKEDLPNARDLGIAVKKEFRGMGLGTQLIKKSTREAIDRGVKKYYGFILENNYRMMKIAEKYRPEIRKSINTPQGKLLLCVADIEKHS